MPRPPSAESILRKAKFEPKVPIAPEMFIPNHSGIASHPEAVGTFVKKSGDTMTGTLTGTTIDMNDIILGNNITRSGDDDTLISGSTDEWTFTTGNINRVTINNTETLIEQNLKIQTGSTTNIVLDSPFNSDSRIDFVEGDDIGARLRYDGNSNQFKIETGDGSFTTRMTFNRDNDRVGIGTTSLGSTLNIGGDRFINFVGGAGSIIASTGNITLKANNDSNTIIMTGTEVRIAGGVGASSLSINQLADLQPALRLDQKTGGQTGLIDLFDSAGTQTMGVTTLGLTQAGAGSGIARFDVEHTVAPSSADGDGVGLNFRTEDLNGVLRDVAFMDVVFDDISQHEASMRFLVKDGSASNSAPAELMRIEGESGNVGIGLTAPTGILHIDQSSTTGAKPVLILDQADLSEEMIEFVSTIGTGNALEAIGAKALTTTHFIKVTLPGSLTRYIPCGTIA